MKKLMLVVAVGGLFALASCKKDYTCECTQGGQTYKQEWKDMKKKDAESACDTFGAIYTAVGGSCELK